MAQQAVSTTCDLAVDKPGEPCRSKQARASGRPVSALSPTCGIGLFSGEQHRVAAGAVNAAAAEGPAMGEDRARRAAARRAMRAGRATGFARRGGCDWQGCSRRWPRLRRSRSAPRRRDGRGAGAVQRGDRRSSIIASHRAADQSQAAQRARGAPPRPSNGPSRGELQHRVGADARRDMAAVRHPSAR